MGTIRVKATQLGFDGMQRRREGDEFEVREEAFSAKWMKKVKPKAPAEEEEEEDHSKHDKGKAKGKTTRASDEPRI